MNKKHLSFLLVFGIAAVCVLMIFVKGLGPDTALCLLYNCFSAFFALVWGGAFSLKGFGAKDVSGILLGFIIAVSMLETLVHTAN